MKRKTAESIIPVKAPALNVSSRNGNVLPSSTEKKPTDEALATLMLDRQERMERCGKVIGEVLKKENCTLFAPVGITDDGRIVVPSIQIKALD
jgi:hypothetical protein